MHPSMSRTRDKRKRNSFLSLRDDIEKANDTSLSKTSLKRVKPECVTIMNVDQSPTSEICIQDSRFECILGFNYRIPKQIVSVVEKYLRRRLELIYISLSNAISLGIPPNLGVLLSKSSSSIENRSGTSFDLAKFVMECPLTIGTEDWFVGRLMRSKSMMNILKSPIFRKFCDFDSDFKFERTNLIDHKGDICNFASSPGVFSISSSHKLENEKVILGNHSYESEPLHKRFIYERSSSSFLATTASTQGMLHCTWKAGFPHYVFSIDDQREVYFVANISKAESSSFDYLYSFYSRKEYGSCGNEYGLVGKMRVHTSFTLCPRNSEITETEFVLFGSEENFVGERKISSHMLRKNKGFSKKVVEVFKTKRSSFKFEGTGDFLENFSRDPCDNSCDDLDTKFELGAIVVKNHVCNNPQEIGGWGLKFLKKVGIRQTNESLEASSLSSECCAQNNGGCSTSIDVLVPAGFHGGPRTRNGGPSGLIERWRSGGGCDCGGWDIGCPLTVLDTRPSKKEEDVDSTNRKGECKSCDLFMKGSEQGVPVMKLIDIHDGLYNIHFHSALSALQSFSIAVAIIHTRSPSLRPKMYRS